MGTEDRIKILQSEQFEYFIDFCLKLKMKYKFDDCDVVTLHFELQAIINAKSHPMLLNNKLHLWLN